MAIAVFLIIEVHTAITLIGSLQDEFNACTSQITASRQRDMAELSANQVEQLSALGFVLEQLQRNIKDLERCIQEWV